MSDQKLGRIVLGMEEPRNAGLFVYGPKQPQLIGLSYHSDGRPHLSFVDEDGNLKLIGPDQKPPEGRKGIIP